MNSIMERWVQTCRYELLDQALKDPRNASAIGYTGPKIEATTARERIRGAPRTNAATSTTTAACLERFNARTPELPAEERPFLGPLFAVVAFVTVPTLRSYCSRPPTPACSSRRGHFCDGTSTPRIDASGARSWTAARRSRRDRRRRTGRCAR